MSRTPTGPPPPPVAARVRIRYAKRGRLRFSSHRDFARALERALRRADVPMAYSAGFTPHPKISYVGAAPTGAASEAEYVEIGLTRAVDLGWLCAELDAALPPGLDVLEAVPAGPGSLAERIVASHWRIELPAVAVAAAREAVHTFLQAPAAPVERMTKAGRREVDARAAVIRLAATEVSDTPESPAHAILDVVVRQVTPAVRPEDVMTALRDIGGLGPAGTPEPPLVTRLAQGLLDDDGSVSDPLAVDRTPQS